MLAADDPGDLAFGGGSAGSAWELLPACPPPPAAKSATTCPELDIDATLAAAEGRSTKK